MLENVGLGGVLTFDGKAAEAGMKSAGSVADQFSQRFGGIVDVAKRVGENVGKFGAAMGKLGLAATPATVAFGFAFDKSVDFEKQMSAVGSVSQATAEEMQALTVEAKKQGATTAFSATEAAQGLELLGRAGFSQAEKLAALGPVLSAASADGIELATSADIIANTLKGMGLPATEAAHAADVLALASAKTNTNMTELGEAMRYASPQAKTMGVSLETTTAVLGALADAGLKGSIGGTSFTQSLIKLANPTREGEALLKKFNITMTKTADGGLDMVDVFKQIHRATSGIADVVERARVTEELFGVRGQKAFTSMETAIDANKIDGLVSSLKKASDEVDGYQGAAAAMAAKRLDNFAGSVTLLRSALEGFALETAGRFTGVLRQSIDQYVTGISNVVLALQELNSEQGLTEETAKRMGPTITGIAKGIKEGIDLVVSAWTELRTEIADTIKGFTGEQSEATIQSFTKIATVIFLVTAAVAPVLIAFGGLVMFVTGVLVPAITALGGIFMAVFSWPIAIGAGLVIAAFMLIHKEGESVGETFQRIGDAIKNVFDWLMDTVISPFASGFQWAIGDVFGYIGDQVMDWFHFMHNTFATLIDSIVHIVNRLAPAFKVAFTLIGNVVGVVANIIGFAFTSAMWVVGGVVKAVAFTIQAIIEGIAYAISAIAMAVGGIGEALGLEWGAKVRKWGQADFEKLVPGQATATTEAKKTKAKTPAQAITDTGIDKAKLAELDKQAQLEAISLVGEKMPKEINVESKVCVDGKTVATATAKHKQEINERAGFKSTPWQIGRAHV